MPTNSWWWLGVRSQTFVIGFNRSWWCVLYLSCCIRILANFLQSATSGDSVLFVFSQRGNYSVTQSSFDHPCQKSIGGFDSGLCVGIMFLVFVDLHKPILLTIRIPVSAQAIPHIDEYTVNSSQPIWFYSDFHCKSGMVFAINPGNSFPDFQQLAMGAVDASTTKTTVTATSTVVVPGRGTATSTLVSLSLVPTATAATSSNPNGAGWVKHRADIVTAMSVGIGLQFTTLYYPLWW